MIRCKAPTVETVEVQETPDPDTVAFVKHALSQPVGMNWLPIDELEIAEPEEIDSVELSSIDPDNIDGLIAAYARIDRQIDDLIAAKTNIRAIVKEKVKHLKTKTRRLAGTSLAFKVTMPDDSWEQEKLRKVWNTFQDLAPQYLKISEISPIAAEVKKLENTAGEGGFEEFREAVLAAKREPTALPTLSIEKPKNKATKNTTDESDGGF